MTWEPLLDLVLEPMDTSWMPGGACTAMPGLPWIDCPSRVPPFVVELMAETCAHCLVRARCESFVDEARITGGFWAGRSQDHRSEEQAATSGSLPWEAA
jgi:hypothetical protein